MSGIDRLHNLRDELHATGAEMAKHRERFNRLRKAEPARAVSAFNLFQTPEVLADRMAGMIPSDAQRILEPSAGLGRLYRAARHARPSASITLVESSSDCCGELYRSIEGDSLATLMQRDFMEYRSPDQFDCVLMNPPFKQGRDIKHIDRAAQMLRPGGVLIGLCYDGVKQGKHLRPLCSTWEPLGAGVFKESGTMAGVVLLTIEV